DADGLEIITTGNISFGVEADTDGTISLTNSSITTSGQNAAGVRALSGAGQEGRPGCIELTGTQVTTSGSGSVGLMAGDEDGGGGPTTAGNIKASGVTVTAEGANAAAARVLYGSHLEVLANSTLTSEHYHGVVVDGSNAAGNSTAEF